MEISHGRNMEYEFPEELKHRENPPGFKFLATGQEGTLENFVVELAYQKEFFSPRHRHNFDQFRYAVKGDFSIGPDTVIRQGQLAYHPEGVFYGPQNDGPDEHILLLVQFGGASKQGFVPYESLKTANRALSEVGEFRGGRYYPNDGESKDGYEAAWEYIAKRKLEYPAPRYHTPIVTDPTNFSWKPISSNNRVSRKALGTFSERETKVEMLKVEASGSVKVGGDDAIHILYTVDGSGEVEGEQLLTESTVKLPANVTCEIKSEEGMELLHFIMPMIRY